MTGLALAHPEGIVRHDSIVSIPFVSENVSVISSSVNINDLRSRDETGLLIGGQSMILWNRIVAKEDMPIILNPARVYNDGSGKSLFFRIVSQIIWFTANLPSRWEISDSRTGPMRRIVSRRLTEVFDYHRCPEQIVCVDGRGRFEQVNVGPELLFFRVLGDSDLSFGSPRLAPRLMESKLSESQADKSADQSDDAYKDCPDPDVCLYSPKAAFGFLVLFILGMGALAWSYWHDMGLLIFGLLYLFCVATGTAAGIFWVG